MPARVVVLVKQETILEMDFTASEIWRLGLHEDEWRMIRRRKKAKNRDISNADVKLQVGTERVGEDVVLYYLAGNLGECP